jgi:hypothetical protein
MTVLLLKWLYPTLKLIDFVAILIECNFFKFFFDLSELFFLFCLFYLFVPSTLFSFICAFELLDLKRQLLISLFYYFSPMPFDSFYSAWAHLGNSSYFCRFLPPVFLFILFHNNFSSLQPILWLHIRSRLSNWTD